MVIGDDGVLALVASLVLAHTAMSILMGGCGSYPSSSKSCHVHGRNKVSLQVFKRTVRVRDFVGFRIFRHAVNGVLIDFRMKVAHVMYAGYCEVIKHPIVGSLTMSETWI